MAELTQSLATRIRAGGPISVAEYMAEALGHPQWGYYTSHEPFGAKGDFITAPEISQMFGELLGIWAVVTWQMLGAPARFILAEMGPGRGTLMADALRAVASVPGFLAAAEIWLVETSPRLQEQQRQTLQSHAIHWCREFGQVPDAPLILIANELFDALPIRQFVRASDGWHERLVGVDDHGALAFVTGPLTDPEVPESVLLGAGDGAIVETCPQGRTLAGTLGQRLAATGGAALIIDYGPAQWALGDSLQAVRRHQFAPVLADPGSADITAHVDFQSLARAAAPARAWGPVTQGDFLSALGIHSRAAMLAAGASAQVAGDIAGQMRRLIDPAEMGTLFKVLALAHPALPAPAGFAS